MEIKNARVRIRKSSSLSPPLTPSLDRPKARSIRRSQGRPEPLPQMGSSRITAGTQRVEKAKLSSFASPHNPSYIPLSSLDYGMTLLKLSFPRI